MNFSLDFFKNNRRYILPASFIIGFVFDYLTLNRVDRLYENSVLLSYIVIAAIGIAFLHSKLFISREWLGRLRIFTPVAIQFVFGGLFSGFLVFYSNSASFAASWPFLLLLVGLFIGNEIFKEKYSQLTFQVSVFFFVLFSYLIFLLPILLGQMNSWIFLLSGLTSLLVISLFLQILKIIDRKKIEWSRDYLTLSIGGIFFAVNIFYFTNILPPIPLSLKDAGIYYSVERADNGEYLLKSVSQPWYNFIKKYKRIPLADNQPLYAFSSVFAPTALRTNIVHNWQYYDPEQNKWISELKMSFPASGGRNEGYRGYSKKENLRPGYWQVNIETPSGLVIGRIYFLIKKSAS